MAERYGRPLALYTDKNGLLVTSRPVQWQEQLHDTPPRTQFGRALAELDIEWIAAHSPQAKGRIERLFQTLQDRLVKEMRVAEIRYASSRPIAFWRSLSGRPGASALRSTGTEQRRASPIAARAAAGTDSQRASGAHRRFRPHREMGGPTVGPAARTSLCRIARRSRRDRAAAGRLALAAFSRPLLAAESLPGRAATRQVLPAYGLQALPIENQNPYPNSKPNTTRLPIIPWRRPWKRTFLSGEKPDISTLR